MPVARRPTRFYPASGLLLVTALGRTALALGSAPGSSWPRGRARRAPAFALDVPRPETARVAHHRMDAAGPPLPRRRDPVRTTAPSTERSDRALAHIGL